MYGEIEMILDMTNLFSDDQILTADTASENVIDLGSARDIGKGNPVPLLVQVTEDATGTNPSLKVDIEVSDDAAFSVPEVIASSNTLDAPKAGDKLSISYMPEGIDKRYVRLEYVVGGTSPSMKVTAGIVAGHGA